MCLTRAQSYLYCPGRDDWVFETILVVVNIDGWALEASCSCSNFMTSHCDDEETGRYADPSSTAPFASSLHGYLSTLRQLRRACRCIDIYVCGLQWRELQTQEAIDICITVDRLRLLVESCWPTILKSVTQSRINLGLRQKQWCSREDDLSTELLRSSLRIVRRLILSRKCLVIGTAPLTPHVLRFVHVTISCSKSTISLGAQ